MISRRPPWARVLDAERSRKITSTSMRRVSLFERFIRSKKWRESLQLETKFFKVKTEKSGFLKKSRFLKKKVDFWTKKIERRHTPSHSKPVLESRVLSWSILTLCQYRFGTLKHRITENVTYLYVPYRIILHILQRILTTAPHSCINNLYHSENITIFRQNLDSCSLSSKLTENSRVFLLFIAISIITSLRRDELDLLYHFKNRFVYVGQFRTGDHACFFW